MIVVADVNRGIAEWVAAVQEAFSSERPGIGFDKKPSSDANGGLGRGPKQANEHHDLQAERVTQLAAASCVACAGIGGTAGTDLGAFCGLEIGR